jgi:hypothetical protein
LVARRSSIARALGDLRERQAANQWIRKAGAEHYVSIQALASFVRVQTRSHGSAFTSANVAAFRASTSTSWDT